MQTMARRTAVPTAAERRAELARLDAEAWPWEVVAQGEPIISEPAPLPDAVVTARAEAIAKGRKRRRRQQAALRGVRTVARVLFAAGVGVVAGVGMYVLAMAGLGELVDREPAPAAPAVTTPAPTTPPVIP
jgi:hypothetical protein